MYSFADLRRAIADPSAAQREIVRTYFSIRNDEFNDSGVDIFEEDWDNLIILDACRYDSFEREATVSGSLQSRVSRGSATSEFITANFAGRHRSDTVYVSSNLWFPKLAAEIDAAVHAFRPVPESSSVGENDAVIVEPDLVTDAALDANGEYPNKRLIVHYSQPHYPYLGETGAEYFEFDDTPNLTEAVRRSGYRGSPDIVRNAYHENLRLALDALADLLPALRGRTVITADHGELLGERLLPLGSRQYGHPEGIYVEPLVRVPWHVHKTGDRKTVSAGTVERTQENEAFIDDRLRNLGYKV